MFGHKRINIGAIIIIHSAHKYVFCVTECQAQHVSQGTLSYPEETTIEPQGLDEMKAHCEFPRYTPPPSLSEQLST